MARELAVAARSDPQQPHKGAPHHVDITESSVRGHLFEASLHAFQLTTRGLHARVKHVLRRRRAHLSSKYALEIPHAHRHPIGKMLYREFRLEVLGNPDLQLMDRHHLRSLRGE